MVLHARTRTDLTEAGTGATEGARDPRRRKMTDYDKPDDATQLRRLLDRVGMSQRGAAKELGLSERQMRYYCAGEHPVPKVVMMALEHLVCLQRQVTSK